MGRVGAGEAGPSADVRQVQRERAHGPRARRRPASSIWRAAASRAFSARTTSEATRSCTFISCRVAAAALRGARPGDGAVGEAEVLELPVEVDVGVAPGVEVAEEVVPAAAEPAARVAEGEARDERPEPRLLQADERRLDEGLGLGQLGAVPQAGHDQVVDRAAVADQADHRLGGLDRGDDDVRVEPDPADELGRGVFQLADGLLDVPALAVALGEAPAVVGLEPRAAPGVGGGQVRQGLGVGGGLAGDGQPAGGLLEVEVRLGHAEQGVVRGDLDAGPPGGDRPGAPPAGSKMASENRRIEVRPETCAGPPAGTGPLTLEPAAAVAPRKSELLLIDADRPLDDLRLAVVADPVRADVEAREPEDPGLLQLGQGLADPLAGDGDVQVARPGQPQGAPPGRSARSSAPGRAGPRSVLRSYPLPRERVPGGRVRGSASDDGSAPADCAHWRCRRRDRGERRCRLRGRAEGPDPCRAPPGRAGRPCASRTVPCPCDRPSLVSQSPIPGRGPPRSGHRHDESGATGGLSRREGGRRP